MARTNDLAGYVSHLGRGDTCKVIVFSEDAAARIRAWQVCERLLDQFGDELDFEFGWWRLDRLADASLAQHATHAAAAADIVLFCLRNGAVPPETTDWLESWAESGIRGDGVLALVSTDYPNVPAQVCASQFERAAQRLGLDFIRFTPLTTEAPAAWLPGAELAGSTAADTRHWGLNE